MKKYSDAGIYGLGAMGIALALNIARKYKVTIANRTVQTTYKLPKNLIKLYPYSPYLLTIFNYYFYNP